ncbi:hypothetical protein [Hymenobacter lapidiphilus]|uniref:Uncharacterized protein n=1 Tax=Hymenobacter lapidiphilus TaxID=2608003 RepID=A0A7Y7PM89_9BACT|nr:hypothetical protein [Hymenobacter lapidiphilus]NVO30394.1 hypothetical protein [Hymenobacter lapidiphilus]
MPDHQRGVNSFLLLLSCIGALGNAVAASVFCLCSHESIQRLIQQDGLLIIFSKRWLGFFIFGAVLAAGVALLQLFITSFSHKNWGKTKWIFLLALALQLMAAFVGSLLFTYSIA